MEPVTGSRKADGVDRGLTGSELTGRGAPLGPHLAVLPPRSKASCLLGNGNYPESSPKRKRMERDYESKDLDSIRPCERRSMTLSVCFPSSKVGIKVHHRVVSKSK